MTYEKSALNGPANDLTIIGSKCKIGKHQMLEILTDSGNNKSIPSTL